MWIDVKIPYEPEKRLAVAYNRAMEDSSADWVLLLDHDVFLACNPYWYGMCLNAINTLKNERVGLITCVTSKTNNTCQRAAIQVRTDRIKHHIRVATQLYRLYKSTVVPWEDSFHVAGFFMLVNKSAWEQVRFVSMRKGIDKIDHDFARRLMENGYKIYTLPGLYVFHYRTRQN